MGRTNCTTSTTTAYVSSGTTSAPTITGTYCTSPSASTISTVKGTSSEADGTIIEIFNNGVSLGTTTVSKGMWSKTGLSFSGGPITAKATATCKLQSSASTSVSIGTKNN